MACDQGIDGGPSIIVLVRRAQDSSTAYEDSRLTIRATITYRVSSKESQVD